MKSLKNDILKLSLPLIALILFLIPAMAQVTQPSAAVLKDVAIPVSYTAPADGFVSLALFNDHGLLIRSLLYAKAVKAGDGSVIWDGTSDLGVPQPAGSYSTKAIFFKEKPKAEYVMTVGKSGNPPYRTPDGKGDWGGNLGGPAAVCSNFDSVMVVWSCVEDNQITGIQQMDADGNIKMRYYSFYPWDGRLAGTMDDRNFYLGILNGGKKQVEIAAYELGKPRGKILTVLPTKPHVSGGGSRFSGGFSASINGMALTSDTIFATITADDALFIIDRATGQIRKQITISAPRDVKVANGGLIIQTGNKIVRLTLTGEVERTLVDEGTLTDPGALAVDAQGGFFSSGANGQVARFNADGKLLAKLGKDGGAAATGRYFATAFGGIAAMALGPKDDSLWVQDIATGFPRTTRWSLDGQLIKAWYTSQLDLTAYTVNPERPYELVGTNDAFSGEPGIRAYEIDWANKTWQPGWSYNNTWNEMFACNDVFLGFQHGGNPLNAARGGNSPWPTFHYAGRTFVSNGGKNYFMNSSGNDDGAIFQYSADHKPKPVALIGYHHVVKRDDGKYEGIYDQGPNQWMTWADLNNDGRMSTNEISLVKDLPMLAGVGRASGGKLDANLNVHLQINNGFYILSPKEILPGGVPVYDWSMLRKDVSLQLPDFLGGDGTKKVGGVEVTMPLQADDGLYSLVKPGTVDQLGLPGIDGWGWWASRNWRSKLVKFDSKTGDLLWAVGRRAPGVVEPGQMYSPISVSGKGGDAIFVADALSLVWVWHSDGLYLGQLFRDHHDRSSDVPLDQELYGEIQSTFVFKHPQTGKIYHVGSGNERRIHEITLPTIQRLAATSVTLSTDQSKIARPWDPDGRTPTDKPSIIITPSPGKKSKEVTVDGILDGQEAWSSWDGVIWDGPAYRPTMQILLDGQHVAKVNAMYDDKNLYLGYTVMNSAGPANSGSELPFAPFVSGAYVDFCIAPDWSQPQRRDVREGDVRVIVARVSNGGPGTETVFQQGFWQKKAGGTNPQTISSPAARVHFDQIAPVPGLQAAYHVDKNEKTGVIERYVVEIAVPLASIGLSDVLGKTIGFDVSVGIANPAGDQRDRAAHWAGLSEGRVVDRPGSAELLPQTWGTLTFAPVSK